MGGGVLAVYMMGRGGGSTELHTANEPEFLHPPKIRDIKTFHPRKDLNTKIQT